MTQPPLTTGLITGDTRLWRLSLQVCPDALEAVVRPIAAGQPDQALIWSRIPFPDAAPTSGAALQEAVYSNPLLVAPFGRVDILVRTARHALLPAAQADAADLLPSLLGWEVESLAQEDVFITPADDNYIVVAAADAPTLHFLRRTFGPAEPRHPLGPLLRWFGTRSLLGNSGKIYVNIGYGRYDLLAFNSLGAAVATTLPAATPDEMCYYILAAAHTAALPLADCEIHIAGRSEVRTALTAALSRFAPTVLPAIFPSALLAYGQKAFGAPLELSILPLCE